MVKLSKLMIVIINVIIIICGAINNKFHSTGTWLSTLTLMAIVIIIIRIKIITIIVIVILRKTELILTEYNTNLSIDHLFPKIESKTDCTTIIIE